MGNRAIAVMFDAAAEIFWLFRQGGVATAGEVLIALDAVGNRFRGADANTGEAMMDPQSPIGRMIAIAFAGSPADLVTDENEETASCPWYDGPLTRFRQRYDFC